MGTLEMDFTFGNFDDLSDADQTLVHTILHSTSNSAAKVQFPWSSSRRTESGDGIEFTDVACDGSVSDSKDTTPIPVPQGHEGTQDMNVAFRPIYIESWDEEVEREELAEKTRLFPQQTDVASAMQENKATICHEGASGIVNIGSVLPDVIPAPTIPGYPGQPPAAAMLHNVMLFQGQPQPHVPPGHRPPLAHFPPFSVHMVQMPGAYPYATHFNPPYGMTHVPTCIPPGLSMMAHNGQIPILPAGHPHGPPPPPPAHEHGSCGNMASNILVEAEQAVSHAPATQMHDVSQHIPPTDEHSNIDSVMMPPDGHRDDTGTASVADCNVNMSANFTYASNDDGIIENEDVDVSCESHPTSKSLHDSSAADGVCQSSAIDDDQITTTEYTTNLDYINGNDDVRTSSNNVSDSVLNPTSPDTVDEYNEPGAWCEDGITDNLGEERNYVNEYSPKDNNVSDLPVDAEVETTCSYVDNIDNKLPDEPQIPVEKPKTVSWAGLFKNSSATSQASVVYITDKSGLDRTSAIVFNERPVNNFSNKVESGIRQSRVATKNAMISSASDVPDLDITRVTIDKDVAAFDIGETLHQVHVVYQNVPLQPRGMFNKGNWCYVNATLQALMACPPFCNFMRKMPCFTREQRSGSCTPILDATVRFIQEFPPGKYRGQDRYMKNPKNRMKPGDIIDVSSFEPRYMYKMLQSMECSSSFKTGRQEDAEEFLSCVLNGLHEEMATVMKCVSDTWPSTADDATGPTSHVSNDVNAGAGSYMITSKDVDGTAGDDDDTWEVVGPKNKSSITRQAEFAKTPISEIFAGQIRSAVSKTGLRDSAVLEPFFTLQLDIQSDKVSSVKDALEGLVSRESVQGFTCSKTKQQVDIIRRQTLETLPPILILHLKFFVFDKTGGSQKLVNKKVDYTMELEINRELLSPNMKSKLHVGQRTYKLFAVVYHHGEKVTGGHYTTDVYHSAMNGWIRIDDSSMKMITAPMVMRFTPPKVPYLLYYRRCDLMHSG